LVAIVIQSTLLRAVHEHSRLIVTCSVPLPPAASATDALAASTGAQRVDDGELTFTEEDDPQLEHKAAAAPQKRALHKATPRRRRLDRLCDIDPRDLTRSTSVSTSMSPHGRREQIRNTQLARKYRRVVAIRRFFSKVDALVVRAPRHVQAERQSPPQQCCLAAFGGIR